MTVEQELNKPIKIHLSQGRVVLIDESDITLIKDHKWHADIKSNGRIYAIAYVRGSGRSSQRNVSMHRLIMSPPFGMDIDHANHNGLDNRRANLRICTKRENQQNKRKSARSVYKGIFRHRNSFVARIRFGSSGSCGQSPRIYLGCFKTETEAAKAYDQAAKKLFGEFALLNFPS